MLVADGLPMTRLRDAWVTRGCCWPACWLRRVSFDFTPQPKPATVADIGRQGLLGGRLAATGKAVLFVVLLFLSAWF